MKNREIKIFDTTLRDGAQTPGILFSVEDKFKIAKVLDDFGIHFIEGGWPGSNQTDEQFFKKAKSELSLKNAQLVAFGSTRHKGNKAQDDPNLCAIVDSKVKYACIFGKTWDLHVVHALKCSLEENLKMIGDSVSFLKQKGLNVIYDAEHFFDGYKSNNKYAVETVKAAIKAGAFNVTLCDTNGGTLPNELSGIIVELKKELSCDEETGKCCYSLGIHAHNDDGCAVANSVIAVNEGVELVQGTINGYGERCGNANLCSIIPSLQLKLGMACVDENKLKGLTELSRYVSEIVNIIPDERAPYVGLSAFTHKAGIHVSAMSKHTSTYEHIAPEAVGNERRIIISELAGRSNIATKVRELKLDFAASEESVEKIIHVIKKLEHEGYQFENADGSFAITARKALGKHKPFFNLEGFRVVVEKDPKTGKMTTEATLKVEVDGRVEHTAAEGDGPVNALDNALRKALDKFYPELKDASLSDFKVRVINAKKGTAAKVKVTIETKDKTGSWGTVGVSENIIEASWQALVDAVEYKLLKDKKTK